MSRAKPSSRQIEYQAWELGVFCHLGIRTFYEGHKDCDGKAMSPAVFNPSKLDCRQWARTVKEAGGKYMVLTAKHHCGFANWPSAYTNFSVASSPWKNGKGDVVREFVDACREYGLKIGLYYSPFDAECPTYEDTRAYDDYFINQMTELLGGSYGQIDMLWFDGAHSEGHQYDWSRIIGEIRRQQPGILIFNMGDPDYRWCGNEDGFAHYPNWNVTDAIKNSIFSECEEKRDDGAKWLPQECDFRIRERNWFYSDRDADSIKGPDELIGNYYYTVGRGANMLLNIAPDRRGLLPDKDSKSFVEMGQEIKRRFESPILSKDDFENIDNLWVHRHDEPCWGNSFLIDHLVVQENLLAGESIQKFRIKILMLHNENLDSAVTVYEGSNVGNKAICQFPPARCQGVIFEVLKSSGPVNIKNIEAFCSLK